MMIDHGEEEKNDASYDASNTDYVSLGILKANDEVWLDIPDGRLYARPIKHGSIKTHYHPGILITLEDKQANTEKFVFALEYRGEPEEFAIFGADGYGGKKKLAETEEDDGTEQIPFLVRFEQTIFKDAVVYGKDEDDARAKARIIRDEEMESLKTEGTANQHFYLKREASAKECEESSDVFGYDASNRQVPKEAREDGETRRCSICGTEIQKPSWKFCPKCGQKIGPSMRFSKPKDD